MVNEFGPKVFGIISAGFPDPGMIVVDYRGVFIFCFNCLGYREF